MAFSAFSYVLKFTNSARFLLRNKCLKSQVFSFHKYTSLNIDQTVRGQENIEESDSDAEEDKEKTNTVNLKLRILDASLNFVPQHGWSKNSLALGAKSLGISSISHGLIQDGGADLVHYFNFLCNENLAAYLNEKNAENTERRDISYYIEDALEKRLKMVIPFVNHWSEAMALMASPTQIPSDLENLYHLVDLIWLNSGVNNLEATWYSKRISLALSYKSCELSLVQDKSPEFSDTFTFLQRRVESILSADQFFNRITDLNKKLPTYITGASVTAQNMLGIRQFR